MQMNNKYITNTKNKYKMLKTGIRVSTLYMPIQKGPTRPKPRTPS